MTNVPRAQCKVCQHPQREEIEADIVHGRGHAAINKKYDGISYDSVRRHTSNHLAPAMRQALKTVHEQTGHTALARLESLYKDAKEVLDGAKKDGARALSLQAIKELRGIVELLAKLTGELDPQPQVTVNIAALPEWAELQQTILVALASFPEARLAVARALTAGDAADRRALPADIVEAEVVEPWDELI
ncbi:MAG: hypothetical protein Q4G46_00190 [Propionibacteriaceae bacterium]|nr:hypothetical protein [Propionibacteriaceae bacterium]